MKVHNKTIGIILIALIFLASCNDEEKQIESITKKEQISKIVNCDSLDPNGDDSRLLPFYQVLWGQTDGLNQYKGKNNIERMDEILETLYGKDTWLRVYVQHNRNYKELCKRVNVVLCGEVEGKCLND